MNRLTTRNNVILSLLLNKDAKGIDEQGNNEQQETPGLIYLHNNGCVLLNRRQSSDFFSGCGA